MIKGLLETMSEHPLGSLFLGALFFVSLDCIVTGIYNIIIALKGETCNEETTQETQTDKAS